MVILQAIILGIIEGLTEFLPISSTGHLIVAQHAMGYKDTAEIFTVVVQLGAVAAVLWFYRRDLISKVQGLIGRDKVAIAFWKVWVIATIPAALAGFFVEKSLGDIANSKVVAVTLILGGIAIWLIETYHKAKPAKQDAQLEKITPKQALMIGLYQILALIPGTSRSGATIMGGLLSGLDRVTATAFSFYMSIPILLLAGIYKLLKDRSELATVSGGGVAIVAGMAAAFITAFLVIGWLLQYVSRHNFKIFAYYRVVLGIIILLLISVA